MSIRGSNFENQHPFASDHALVWEHCMPDGLLYGVDMSFSSTRFTLGTGFMLVAGRMFEITAAENISISPGSGYARVYVAIDTGGAATENSFNQVSFGVDYAANLDAFTELTQDAININQGAAVYQAEVAVLSIDSTGATAIERQMELVSPGAGTGAFAAIAVTYPAGSTVTVTDGKITYTAPNTNGAALFIIPYAATWIVTATDGTETATQTVEITSEGQSINVELHYNLVLINESGITVPFSMAAASSVSITGTIEGNVFKTNSKNPHVFYTTDQIDLTEYKTLTFAISFMRSWAASNVPGFGVFNTSPTYSAGGKVNFAAETKYSPTSSDKVDISEENEKTLDVSALEGLYFVGFVIGGTDAYTGQLTAIEFKLD